MTTSTPSSAAAREIDAVYTHDDDMAEGVIAATENANREDEMFLTGAGGSKAIMDRIEAAAWSARPSSTTRRWPPRRYNLAALIARGEGMQDLTEPEVPSRIQVPATTVTKDNVADDAGLAY